MADPMLAERRFQLHARMVEALAEGETIEHLRQVAAAIALSYRNGGKVILFGNGGSAADAQHVAGEFTGRMLVERPPLPALALADNAAGFSAIGNDYGYVEVFARQIRALGHAGDIAIGLSTSGGSANVLAGMRVARDLDLVTVGVTGTHGHRLAELSDHTVRIPADDTPVIQEGTMLALHTICVLVDDELFGE
jgi:D-sedoheptulose 7-phosphate isomerase